MKDKRSKRGDKLPSAEKKNKNGVQKIKGGASKIAVKSPRATLAGAAKPKTANKSNKGNKPVKGQKTPPKAAAASAVRNKSVPRGRTLKTKDKYLPHDKKRVVELKEKRWVAVVDKNDKEELAVVRLTDEAQSNTTKLSSYKKGNKKTTYFKHFIELRTRKAIR